MPKGIMLGIEVFNWLRMRYIELKQIEKRPGISVFSRLKLLMRKLIYKLGLDPLMEVLRRQLSMMVSIRVQCTVHAQVLLESLAPTSS